MIFENVKINKLFFMPKIDFWAFWYPEKSLIFFLPKFGSGNTKIIIKIHLDANPGAEI